MNSSSSLDGAPPHGRDAGDRDIKFTEFCVESYVFSVLGIRETF
jgi:hypothetical protein